MNNLTEKIVAGAAQLVSFDNSPSDPTNPESKLSLDFYVAGILNNYGTKKVPVYQPLAINKRSVNDLFRLMAEYTDLEDKTDSHEGRLEILSAYPDNKLAGKLIGSWDANKKDYKNGLIGGALISIVTEMLANIHEVEDKEKFIAIPAELSLSYRTILAGMSKVIADTDNSPSQADPFLTVKRIFSKVSTYAFLSVAEDPASIVVSDLDGQIAALQALQEKAKEVTKDEYLKFLEEKKSNNGLDEEGYVKLKGQAKKEEKKAE